MYKKKHRYIYSRDTEKQSEQWANMGTEELKQEIGGLRDILSNFAKVPAESIRGYRSPNLQSNGNFTMDALQELDFSFDNSYSTIENARPSVWPYTLDYGFQQVNGYLNCEELSWYQIEKLVKSSKRILILQSKI